MDRCWCLSLVSKVASATLALMRVLLVEDEERLGAMVSDGLSDQGISVDVERDGASGLWRAREGSYDVIVLDIMLPQMNGYQVCRALRDADVWTPVLMLTAKLGEFDEAEALDTGADDFLRKPFSFVVLLARLRALARRGAPSRPTVLTHGPLRLDPAAVEVSRNGEVIALTPREYAIFEMLMRAGGDPVPSRRILDHVWGFDADPASNVVQVNIRYLRRKIDDPYDLPVIETVRGVGYRLATGEERST